MLINGTGGPLVIRGNDPNGADDVQVGVVSWGIGCASPIFPGVYSRISSAFDWIRKEVCERSRDPASYFECDVETDGIAGSKQFAGSSDGIVAMDISSDLGWHTIVKDDFLRGFGVFNRGGRDAVHYKFAKERTGVIRIQDGNGQKSSIFSQKVSLEDRYSRLKVCFSFYAISMEKVDSFCLDHSIDAASKWTEKQCWFGRWDFPNKQWIDDKCVEFDVPAGTDSLSIRFRCHGDDRRDDVLIDKVEIQGLVGSPILAERVQSKAEDFIALNRKNTNALQSP